MAYGLRAYWSTKNHNDVTDYLHIYQDGYTGSSLQITDSTGFTFKHQEISSDSNEGYLNPTYNKILMGVLDWNVWGKDASTKQLIEDIKTGSKKEYYIQWAQGTTGDILWQGYASGRILSYPEKEKYIAKLQFKDFEVLKTQEYTPTDNRQKVIQTIADLISQLGLDSLRYTGNVLRTFTSWQAQGTTLTDDFLNQVYHDTIQLRNYGRQGNETDTSISVYDALKYTAAPQLLIYQMNGAFNVIQLSAFEDSQNVVRGDYQLNGTAAGVVTVDLEQTIYTDKDLGLPVLIDSSQVTTYPALQSATVEFDHKSLDANITVPQTVTISSPSEQKYTMNVRLSGDESIIFTARNISRVTVPYYNYDVFGTADVNISIDTIDVTPGLSIDQKVRFENNVGALPGGLSSGVTYYAKPYAGNDYYFDTFPNRLNNPVDITSDGGAGSASKVLTIEEVTLKNAEFALTLGANFLDTGTGSFLTPGLSYTGMSSSIINLTTANINTTTDSVDFTGHGLKDGQLVIFTNTGGSLPGGIDADTFYYVVNSSTNSFQISDSYGGSFITLTNQGSGAHTVQRASMVRGLSDTLKLAEYVGDLSFEITDLPHDQTVELNLHLFPTRVLESEIASGYIDETLWLDTIVQFIDPSNPESTSIVYKLEQNTAVASDDLTLPAIRYGDGPYVWSRSAYRTSNNLEDITVGWKRRSQASYVNFEELLLKEVIDTQRSRPTKINANIIGNYEPVNVSVYDGSYYAYVGGTYNGRWRPTLVQINIQTGTDTLTTIKRIDQSGNQGIIVTPPETEGLTESEADSRYLRILNNLGDVNNVDTSRTNLGLGTGDTPTFNGIVSTGTIITDEIDTTSITWNVSTQVWDATPSEKFNNPVYISTSLDVDNGINADQHIHAGTYLKADTYLEVGTSATIGTTLDVTGATTLSTLDVSGNTTVGGTLSVTGNTTISGTLDAPTLNTGQGDNELYAMNQDVQTTDGVIFDTLSVTNNTTIGGSLTLTGSADFNSTMNLQGNLTTQSNLQDDGYATGWSGTNWQIQADGSAEFEELRVRGSLRVYEFIAKQISTVGGSEILSIANGKIESVNAGAETSTITLDWFDTTSNGTGTPRTSFKVDDLWIVQEVDINNDKESGGSGAIVKSVNGRVTEVNSNVITVEVDGGSASDLEQGDLVVAYGNISDANRQAIMYRNVDREEDNLIMRLQTGVNEFSKLQAVGNTRVAFGDLNGYSSLSAETFGFFAGNNSASHILATSSGLFLKDGSTTLAQLTSNTFKVGDSTNFLSFNGTSFDIATTSFSLNTTNLDISSANQNIVIGTGTALMTVGKLSDVEQGIKIDSNGITNQNYWKLGQGNVQFKVGNGTNFLSFNENAGTFEIETQAFRLDTTASGGGIDIDSTTQTIKLEDSNKVRTQVDITNGSPSVSVDVNQSISAQTITDLSAYETTVGTYYNVDLGDAVEVFVTASLTTLTNAGGATFNIALYGGNSSTSATNLLAQKRSQIISSGSTSLYLTAYSYTYNYFKVRIEADIDNPGEDPPTPAVTFTTSTFTVKSYESQTRIALDGVYVNNDSTQYARLTRDSNKLSGLTILENLPTGDPKIAGAIYNDGGTLKISAG
jgi:hypothetical protein